MAKLTTTAWMQGALLAFGHMGLAGIATANTPSGEYDLNPGYSHPWQGNWQLQVPNHIPELQPYTKQQRPVRPQRPATPQPTPQSRYQQPSVRRASHRLSWQPAPARPVPDSQALVTPARQAVLNTAYHALGITYRWGGNTPKEGFDCSGLTKFSLKKANVSIPRTAAEQSQASRTVSRKQLRPGDMIFFRTSGRKVNHVGIYVGDGKFIHAASGGGRVTLDDLRRNYWQKRLVKYGTFLA